MVRYTKIYILPPPPLWYTQNGNSLIKYLYRRNTLPSLYSLPPFTKTRGMVVSWKNTSTSRNTYIACLKAPVPGRLPFWSFGVRMRTPIFLILPRGFCPFLSFGAHCSPFFNFWARGLCPCTRHRATSTNLHGGNWRREGVESFYQTSWGRK